MSLYSSPPPARAFNADKATLLVCWWCTSFAAVIIFFRVCGRYIRSEKLFKEDWLAFVCLIPLLCRMALVHVVLLYGTNNAITTGLTDEEIWHRSIGSRLVLVSRIFYAATYVGSQTFLQTVTNICLDFGCLNSPLANSSNALHSIYGLDHMRLCLLLSDGSWSSHSLPWSLLIWPNANHLHITGRWFQIQEGDAVKDTLNFLRWEWPM